MKVGPRFTVHALNEQDLDSIFDLAIEHDVQRLCIYHLAYAGRGGKMQKVDLTAERTRAVVDRIIERTRQCHADGVPLEVLTVGNHADAAYLLLQLEATDPRLTVLRDRVRHLPDRCQSCRLLDVCNGNLRTRAESATGD